MITIENADRLAQAKTTGFETPILFLIFNRPEQTQKVFNQIRQIKPAFLFIGADGPRKSRLEDFEKCSRARDIVLQGVDWDCEVKTLFRDENLGCGKAVSTAISWFFETVEKGIILEDDCLPNKAFFQFSESLLNYYRIDERIMHIGGGSFARKSFLNSRESYYYSKYSYSWGWATWKRSWAKYDDGMRGLSEFIEHDLKEILVDGTEHQFWAKMLNDVQTGAIDTWDFKWNYAIWLNRGLCVHTTKNYIQNIGFGKNATHTVMENENYKGIVVDDFFGALVHPKHVEINERADWNVFQRYNLQMEPSTLGKIFSRIFNF